MWWLWFQITGVRRLCAERLPEQGAWGTFATCRGGSRVASLKEHKLSLGARELQLPRFERGRGIQVWFVFIFAFGSSGFCEIDFGSFVVEWLRQVFVYVLENLSWMPSTLPFYLCCLPELYIVDWWFISECSSHTFGLNVVCECFESSVETGVAQLVDTLRTLWFDALLMFG